MQRETLCEENGDAAAMLVPLDDFEAWRNALIRLRDEAELAEALGARARALVARRFTLDRMIDGFETIILGEEKERRDFSLASRAA
jgi:glycosyltransferase involved in cell wall biosynthesis